MLMRFPLKDYAFYWFLRGTTIWLRFLPYTWIHTLGRFLGKGCYYISRKYRKRVMQNLTIATRLSLSEEKKKQIAKESFGNLVTTVLEYFRLEGSCDSLDELVEFEHFEEIQALRKKGQPMVFFTGHLANWEVGFLHLASFVPGVGVGKPTRNKRLYQWIVGIREMTGAEVIPPFKALSQGLQRLREGFSLGWVGDQAMPESSYHYPFLGTRMFASSAPALLAYRTSCPLIPMTTRRENGRYVVSFYPAIWPQTDLPLRCEVVRLMQELFLSLEKAVKEHPGQYLWQHNQWKQVGVNQVPKRYRHDFILVILPEEYQQHVFCEEVIYELQSLYPRSFFTFMTAHPLAIEGDILYYSSLDDILVEDWRYQLVFDFYEDSRIGKHFLHRGAYEVLTAKDLKKMAKGTEQGKLADLVVRALSREYV